MLVQSPDGALRLPALATAHSHAFQRAMRGRAQRPGARAARRLLDLARPDVRARRRAHARVDRTRSAASPTASSRAPGVRTVGEFHYVHHQPGGTPYDDRTILADAVIRAAARGGAAHRAAPRRVPPRRRRPRRRRRRSAASAIPTSTTSSRRRHPARALGPATRTCASASRRTRSAPCRPAWLRPIARVRRRATRSPSTCTSPSSRARSTSASPRPAGAPSSCSPTTASWPALRRGPRHPPRAARGRAARRGARASPASARPPSATSATACPMSARCARRACASAPASTATSIIDPLEELRALETARAPAHRARVTFRPTSRTPAGAALARGLHRGRGGVRLRGRRRPGSRVGATTRRWRWSTSDLVLDALVFGAGSSVIERVEPAA